MKYIIGVDGGGTATYVNVCTMEKELLYEWKLGPLNVNGQSYEEAAGTLKQMLLEIKRAGLLEEACQGICVGAAGISNADAGILLKNTLLEGGIKGEILLAGDHETALAAAAEELSGIILIAGTGSICYGRDSFGGRYRAGGYGHIIDDAGSAYVIGCDILKATVRSIDGRGEKTCLSKAVFSNLNINKVEELITWIYAPSRTKGDIAALAVLLEEGLKDKDAVCVGIVDEAINELVRLTKAVVEQMRAVENVKTLVAGGSVLLKNDRIIQGVKRRLEQEYPDLNIVKMQQNAAYGAVKMIHYKLKGVAEK